MDDDELVTGFDSGTLPGFPHESHVRLAFAKLQRMPEAEALACVRAGIRAMAAKAGKPEAYHDTRTVAWFRLIAGAAGGGTSLEFLAGHPEFLRRDLLDDFYSPALLNSPEARADFIEPDLLPLAAPSALT